MNKFPVSLNIFLIFLLSFLINVPSILETLHLPHFHSMKFCLLFDFMASNVLPCSILTILNIFIWRKLKSIHIPVQYNNTASRDLKKSAFKAKISIWVTFFIILTSMINWIPIFYFVSYLP